MATLVIDNFQGGLTRLGTGDINSGLAKYSTTYGNDPFSNPGNLTWLEAATRIDSGESVITDLIMAARPRLEAGVTYVYAIGHTGRLYKIQVNDPSTYNPNYDNPVLLTTLTINSPTFKYGSSINFFDTGAEHIYIGHDVGVTKVDFSGLNEAFVGVAGSYTANVPRPIVPFAQYLYAGNGTNLVQILSGGTVGTYATLSPAFPSGTYVRDLDVVPDGNYIKIVVSRIPPPDLTAATQDTASLSSADSYLFLWNGILTNNTGAYTSYTTYNSYSLNANTSFGDNSYTMGYDLGGAAIYAGSNKVVSLPNSISPNFGAMFSTGNLMGFGSPENATSVLTAGVLFYGQYDFEIKAGLYRFLRATATGAQTDVVQMPVCLIVSNLFYGSSSAGYSGNQVGSAKLYFSALETSSAPTTKYKLYKFTTVPTGLGTTIAGVYETQTQLFSKKVTPKEIRIYGEPWTTNNAFTIELIGSNGSAMSNGSKTFTVGSTLTSGADFAWYTPTSAPTYALGVRITNVGSVNSVINKIEIDYEQAGK